MSLWNKIQVLLYLLLKKIVEPLEESQPRRSARSAKPRDFGPNFQVYLVERDPESYAEAMASHDAPI